jgi:hypothetical protein
MEQDRGCLEYRCDRGSAGYCQNPNSSGPTDPRPAEGAGAASADKSSTPDLCAKLHGFTLHAAVRWGADQRKELEHLYRYITRPAIANERLKRNRAGDVVLQLKSAFKDGTTHVVMSPLEFMQRLAALVPWPRLHLIRFHGVLTPNAKLRVKLFLVR